MAQYPGPSDQQRPGIDHEGRTGEPSAPLEVSPNVASPGDVVHIVMRGPAGGVASVSFTPQAPREGGGRENR